MTIIVPVPPHYCSDDIVIDGEQVGIRVNRQAFFRAQKLPTVILERKLKRTSLVSVRSAINVVLFSRKKA
jgi:hypothetical protein